MDEGRTYGWTYRSGGRTFEFVLKRADILLNQIYLGTSTLFQKDARTANSDAGLLYTHAADVNMTYIVADTQCDIGTGLLEMVEIAETVDAFIGPACDALCQPAGRLAGKWNKPMLSYSCASQTLSDKTLFPTFARSSPIYNEMAYFLVDTIRHFQWDIVTIVEGDGLIWRETATHYEEVFEGAGIDTKYFSMPSDDQHLLEKHLEEATHFSRVYILCAYGEEILYFMCAADTLGLLNGEYAFLAIDFGYMTVSTLGDRPCDEDEELEGLLDFTVEIKKDYTQYQEFVQWIESNSNSSHSHEKTIHAGMLYDAVYLYAKSVEASLEKYNVIANGTTLINFLLNSTFPGITGDVQIDGAGNRISRYMIFNVQSASYVTVAVSNGSMGSSEFFTNVAIKWPGGSTVPPLGRPDCGWNNEFCKEEDDNTLIILLVSLLFVMLMLLTGTIAFVWYRKKKLQEKMESMAWKISYEQLLMRSGSRIGASTYSKFSKASAGRSHSRSQITLMNTRSSLDTMMSNCQLFTRVAIYLGQVVALKRLKKSYVAVTKNVIQEINTLKNLKHPNINTIIGACVEPLKIFVISPYCQRGSLQDVLENDDIKLDKIFKISFATDIAKGMTYLHSSPVKVHGRLKSSNVFIDRNWSCKVGDIQMPKFREGERKSSNGEHAQMYQLLWTAPEILRDPENFEHGTQKADVYAYAIILQEVILRSGPYSYMNTEPEDIINRVKILEHPPFRPKVMAQSEEETLADLMNICWAETPLFRPNFVNVVETLKKANDGKATNLVDQMVHMMGKYADHLEELVDERTEQLEEEKKRTEELLCRMIPKSIANELKLGNPVHPETYTNVSIFFSDIVGFTVLCSESSPVEVVNFLNDLYTCFDTVIENYEVYKVETIGDAYMVVSGVPVRFEPHAEEIATMALDLLSSVTVFKIKHRPEDQLLLRIGLHTGPVAAGVVGLKMPRYCLFGDTVNIASRMESTGLPLKIHISPECKEKLQESGKFTIVNRGPVEVKGKGTVNTFFLQGKVGFSKQLPTRRCELPVLANVT